MGRLTTPLGLLRLLGDFRDWQAPLGLTAEEKVKRWTLGEQKESLAGVEGHETLFSTR